MRALFFAAALVAVATATATADRFHHVASAQPHVELSARVKPPVAAHPPAGRPALDGDDMLHVEALLGSVRLDQEQILVGLVATTPDGDPDKPDYQARLGELYAKQQRTARLLAVAAELAADKQRDPAAKQKALADAAAQHKAAHDALLGAVRTYRALMASPGAATYARMDSALFGLAYVLRTGGHAKDAREVYQRIVVDYPASPYVVEAFLALGEDQFEAGELAAAKVYYEKVLAFPKAQVFWYARYKLGWIELNQKQSADALATFFAVAQGTHGPLQEQLHRAALHDFVRAYAEVGKVDKALAAFQRVVRTAPPSGGAAGAAQVPASDAPGALGMLATLADFYVEQGQADRAIFALRELMVETPTSPHVCEWETTVAREMPIAGSRADIVHEIEQLVRLSGAIKLPAAEAHDCRDAAAEMSGQLARAYHQEAVKTQNAELLAAADALYRAYLGGFTDAPDYGETQYFHAELAWTRAEMAKSQPRLWEAAAEAFGDAVRGGKLEPKLVKVAADAAMQAWMRALAVDPDRHGVELDQSEAAYAKIPAPRALPANEGKLLAAYDLYLAQVKDPRDEELVDVMFLRADLLRRYDHLTDALAGFEQILAAHRDAPSAEDAAQLALDSYNRLHRYDDMLALATRLSGDAKFLASKPALEKTIARLHRTAQRKQAEGLEADGKRTGELAKYVACGSTYLELYNADPLADDGDELLYDAGACFEQGKSLSAARQMFETLQKLFPKSKLAAHSVVRLGDDYAQTASYREAAGKLEDYAAKYAGEDDAYRALSDAVTFRKGVGDDAQAVADTEAFVARFGATHPQAAADAAWTLAAIYDKQGDLDRVAATLRAWLGKYGAAAGGDRVVIAWARIGDAEWKRACPVATVDGACARVTRTAPVRLALKTALVGARCSEDKVETTAVARDPHRVAAAMAAYDKAIAAYDARGGKTGGDERGARFYYASAKLGRAERDFEAYLAQTIPSGLDFDPRSPAIAAKSKTRFTSWLTAKSAAGAAARAQYEAVTQLADGATTIAAVARLGQIAHTMSGQLFRAEVPRNLRTGPFAEEASQAYCDELTAVAEPLEADAIRSYRGCLATSTKLGWFSEWSRLCERELGQLDPQHYPTTSELRRAPEPSRGSATPSRPRA